MGFPTVIQRWGLLPLMLFLACSSCARKTSVRGTDFPPNPNPPSGLSAEECRPCHEEIYASYIQTAHYSSSALPSEDSILGSFSAGENVLRTGKPTTYFQMTQEGSRFFQRAFWQDLGETDQLHTRQEEIGVVVGAGIEGQSYLYWKDGFLYQLPASYLRELDDWVNSPGFPDGEVFFERPVTPRCLECHGTYFELEGTFRKPRYRAGFQLGIACWKCHGDGGGHIARHSGNEEGAPADEIVLPSELTPERQLDLCALCHSGVGEGLRASFTYRPGKDLSRFVSIDTGSSGSGPEEPGGWLANKLFRQSKCFNESPGSTCSTCHNVHLPEGDLARKARACRGCHELQECEVVMGHGQQLQDRCIDCHMPDQASRRLRIHRGGRTLSAAYRNHRIAVYPDAAKQVLEELGGK